MFLSDHLDSFRQLNVRSLFDEDGKRRVVLIITGAWDHYMLVVLDSCDLLVTAER